MRVNPNLNANVNSSIASTEQALQTAVDQLSSGKRVSRPSDDAAAFSSDLRTLTLSANVDRYSKNASAVQIQAHAADAALSSVITSLTQAITLGTEGADGTTTTEQRNALAQQVQGLMTQVVTQANSSSNGVSLFSGTAVVSQSFIQDSTSSNGYTYAGNSQTNYVAVGASLNVTANVPGDQIFTSTTGNVLGSMQSMVTALQSGSSNDVASAVAAVDAAITHVSTVRVTYGNTTNQLSNQEDFLSQETLTLSAQSSALTNIDLATAATNLTQAQTAHSAVLAMAAKILPTSLLDYLK